MCLGSELKGIARGGDDTNDQEHVNVPLGRSHRTLQFTKHFHVYFLFMSSQHSCEGSVIVPILQMITRMRTDTYGALVMGQVLIESLTLVLVTSLLSESEEDL